MLRVAKTVITNLILFIFISNLTTAIVNAVGSTSTVELTIPNTKLVVNGYATANGLVSVTESNSVIMSGVADSLGYFSLSSILSSGIHNISIKYTDLNGRISRTIDKSISLQPQQDNILSVILPPTIERSTPAQTVSGSTVQIRGYTVPSSVVKLVLDYGSNSITTSSSSSGFYEFLLDSSNLIISNHTFYTNVTVGSQVGENSQSLYFEVLQSINQSSPDIIISSDVPPPILIFPSDGASIDGDFVRISGDATPYSQIIIYENGIEISSVLTDEFGHWLYDYEAHSTPVTLSFSACINEKCSVLSNTITLNFSKFKNSCQLTFDLDKYRFWNITSGQTLSLNVLLTSGDGTLNVDWGDSSTEKFDHDSVRPKSINKNYTNPGYYSGSIAFTQANCTIRKNFSVVVVSVASNGNVLWKILLILILIIIFTDLFERRRKRKSLNSEK